MVSTDDRDSERGRPNKVATLIKQYGLEQIGDELEEAWTADGDARRSLRDLADYFNQRLLENVIEREGVRTLDGDVENVYRLLTADDVSSSDRMRVRRTLNREGIDVERLLEDFVSYQAIRSYLQNVRGAEYTENETDKLSSGSTTIQRLRSRTSVVTDEILTRLQNGDDLDVGEFQTLVDVYIICEDCGSRLDVLELLDRGACYCHDA